MPKLQEIPSEEQLQAIPNFFDQTLESRFQCMGCAPNNPERLHISFYNKINSSPLELWAKVAPQPDTRSGFPGLVHGGITALLIDECAYWTLFSNFRVLAFTTEMNVKYFAPYRCGIPVIVKGEVVANSSLPPQVNEVIAIRVIIAEQSGTYIAEGIVKYFIAPAEKIQYVLGNVGVELQTKL